MSLTLPSYAVVAAHVHSRSGITDCDGTQTVDEITQVLGELGFAGLALAQHPTSPSQPWPLYPAESACHELLAHLDQVRQVANDYGVPVLAGIEASILPSGHIDAPAEVTRHADWTLASQHGGLGLAEKDPDSIAERLVNAAHNPFVTGIGHPMRDNEELPVNWPAIFAALAANYTVVELNFNHWVGHAGQPPQDSWDDDTKRWYEGAQQLWDTWLRQLADSGAAVVLGLDIHNDGMWPRPTDDLTAKRSLRKLNEFCGLVQAAGIGPDRCLTSSPDLFRSWVQVPKPERGSLITW